MKYSPIQLMLLAMLLSAAGCQKKDDTPVNPDQLNIQISSPESKSTYRKGDTVFIRSEVSYITQMHGYHVAISDTASASTFYESEDHVHSDHFQVSKYWVDTLSYPVQLRLRITVVVDHEGNTKTQDLYFNSQP